MTWPGSKRTRETRRRPGLERKDPCPALARVVLRARPQVLQQGENSRSWPAAQLGAATGRRLLERKFRFKLSQNAAILGGLGKDVVRVNNVEAREVGKIICIEREPVRDAIGIHDCRKPCVVDLLALAGQRGDQVSPFAEDAARIVQEKKPGE